METVGRITVPPPFQMPRETWADLVRALMTGVNVQHPDLVLQSGAADAFLRISRRGLYDALQDAGVEYALSGNASGEPRNDRWIEVIHITVAFQANGSLEDRVAKAFDRFCASAVLAARAAPPCRVRLLGALEASVRSVQDDAYAFGWKQRLEVYGTEDGSSGRSDEETSTEEQ